MYGAEKQSRLLTSFLRPAKVESYRSVLTSQPCYKLTNTPNNGVYNVPKNSPSIQSSCLSTRCPSKSKIRNILNLRCPKCPSHSNGHFGHPLTKNSPSLTKLITNASNFLVQNNRIMEKQKGKEVNQKTLVAFNQKIEVLTGRLQTK